MIAALAFCVPGLAHAEDEFGARFGNQAPPALTAGEESSLTEQAPQDIEPAAGEEAQPIAILPETSLSTETENNAAEDANEIETNL